VSADVHGPENARDCTRGLDCLGHGQLASARRAHHHPPSALHIDHRDPQATIPARPAAHDREVELRQGAAARPNSRKGRAPQRGATGSGGGRAQDPRRKGRGSRRSQAGGGLERAPYL
jgi:hypothetical protein